MTSRTTRSSPSSMLAGLFTAAALLASNHAWAQAGATAMASAPVNDSPQRVEQKRTDLIGAPGMEVIASTAEYKPGDTVDLHHHHGVEVAYVLQGATVQIPGKPLLTLRSGATLMNLRDIKHGGFKVVGETSLKLFTVHVVDKGLPLYDTAPALAPATSN